MKCPICGNEMEQNEVLKRKTNTPNVLKENELNIREINIPFFKCLNCGHGAIDDILSEDFYDEFTVALDNNENISKANKRNARFEKLIENLLTYGKSNKKILEVGAGCGYLLKSALEYYESGIGIEPSKREAEVAKKLGLHIIIDYFSTNLNLEGNFSAFISTMVFEHLPNPKESIEYLYELLEYEGVGLIQVPNAQRTFSNKIYFDIYPQHLQYFTPLSLSKLVSDAGFEIISLKETSEKNYLEIYVRKPRLIESFSTKLKRDIDYINARLNKYTNVAIWGASYAVRSYMLFFNKEKISYLFDVSNSKIGGYINGFDKEIEYPSAEKVNNCDLIIIMANEYTREIIECLKSSNYTGNIIYFDDNCVLHEKSLNSNAEN